MAETRYASAAASAVHGRGEPPMLEEKTKEAWFKHFDYTNNDVLSFVEVLRGLTKTLAKSQAKAEHADEPPPLSRVASTENRRLRDVLEPVWDKGRWRNGIPLADFVGADGLAQLLLDAMPQLSM